MPEPGVARFTWAPRAGFTAAMGDAWRTQGLLVIEDFADAAACGALVERAGELVDRYDPVRGATVFSTRTHAHQRDRYFVESGGDVRCFLEEDAVDASGALVVPKARAINKIGHALHDLDPVFDRFSRAPAVRAVVEGVGVERPLLLQSMLIFKQPRIGGEVVWHQDATFLRTTPSSVVGLWFALEDAHRDNGCLWAIPGLHTEPVRRMFRRTEGGLSLDPVGSTPWPDDDAVCIEARAGTLVVLHGNLPHRSAPNRSAASRQAYSLHVVDGRFRYEPDNWLQRPGGPALRGFD